MMGYAFVIPYTSADNIPTCFGPIRSSIMTSLRKNSKASTDFKPFSVSEFTNLKQVMEERFIDAQECADTLLDQNEFEKQTAAAKSADSSRSERLNSPKAGRNVRRVRKAKTKQPAPITSDSQSSSEGDDDVEDNDAQPTGEEEDGEDAATSNGGEQGAPTGTVVMKTVTSNTNDASEDDSFESDYGSSDE